MPTQRLLERYSTVSVRHLRGWLATLAHRGPSRTASSREAALLELLGSLRCSHVLEVGCGAGRLIELMLEADALKVAGLDRDPRLLELARRRNRPTIESGRTILKCGDAHAIPWPDHSFSLVVSANVLGALADPQAALSDWFRVLCANGRLAIATCRAPLDRSSPLSRRARGTRPPMRVYDDRALAALLSAAGFTDVRIADAGDLWLATASRPCARTAMLR